MKSEYVDDRKVDIWLPEGYDSSSNQRYAVLYMQVGQMLFDSTDTWNNKEWKVDEVLSRLIEQDKVQATIVVGIWNNGQKRSAEYYPEKVLNFLPDTLQVAQPNHDVKLLSNEYLQFLVKELKPYIDKNYAVYTDNHFKSLEFKGDKHDEVSWAERLHIPLQFLLGK